MLEVLGKNLLQKKAPSDDLTIILNMTDDISGIKYTNIKYENPYGDQNSGNIDGNISWSWTNLGDNNYSITTKLS